MPTALQICIFLKKSIQWRSKHNVRGWGLVFTKEGGGEIKKKRYLMKLNPLATPLNLTQNNLDR